MQISYPSFDQLVTTYFPDVYRLCLLLTGDTSGAWQTAFQTFLYMGTQKEPFPEENAEQDALFSGCVRTCTDYYYRKIRRRKRRDRFEQNVSFPVSDSLWKLLGMPFKKKTAIFFTEYLGFTPERTALVVSENATRRKSAVKTSQTCQCASEHSVSFENIPQGGRDKQWQEAIASISPIADGASQMLGELYLRFEERNVSLENKLRNIRYWWDHTVIWIAGIIILLFFAAAWYTATLVV